MVTDQSVPSTSTQTETAKLLCEAIVKGATLKDIQGVPDSVMEGIYAHAYNFYQIGRLDDAEVCFRFLCLYDTYKSDYVMGLAATLQQQKQYHQAIDAYELTFALAKNNYRPKFHIGQCYLFLKDKERAREYFSAVLKSDAPEVVKTQASAYLSTMKVTKQSHEVSYE